MWQTKRFIFVAILMAVVISGSLLGISCSSGSSDGDTSEEPADTSQEANPPEGMPSSPGFLSDELLARVAEILSIDQQTLEDAFTQAQSEMASVSGEGQSPGTFSDDGPPEGTSPPDMPSEGMSPEDMPSEDMPREDMSPEDMPLGFGLPDELLARVAEILGIDQQELADAVEQAQSEMAGEVTPPNSVQE